MPRFLIPILTYTFLSTTHYALAQSNPQSPVSILGDGHSVHLTETGPGVGTVIDLDGHDAKIDIHTMQGGQTRLIAHGRGGQVKFENRGADLTVISGGCDEGRTPRLTHGNAGVSFVTCY